MRERASRRGRDVVAFGEVLWRPTDPDGTPLAEFGRWIGSRVGVSFGEYHDLWQWSIDNVQEFWSLVAEYFELIFHAEPEAVLADDRMPGAAWFPGARLNYAEHVFRHGRDRPDEPAIIAENEAGAVTTLSWRELAGQAGAMARALVSLGVGEGDRVIAYAPHRPETVIAFLACASIGAIWSCCSPDFGTRTVVDRFSQIKPKLLIAASRYTYGGVDADRVSELKQIVEALPSLENIMLLPGGDTFETEVPILDWAALIDQHDGGGEAPIFASLPFDHPLWVLYSSGTTGKPKAIVHGHGGILIEHVKSHGLHLGLGPRDRFFWFTTTGWVMWNVVVGGLLTGSTIVLFDGNPGFPDPMRLWRLAERHRVTYFGVGAAFLTAAMKAGLRPKDTLALQELKTIGSTGSPLGVDAFAWVYDAVKSDVCVASSSGGTDIGGGFIGGVPTRPVRAGQLQGRMLGAAVEAFDGAGQPLTGSIGEMVITRPMPSMPLYFWNDPGDVRLKESYFEDYPGIWRHGDFLEITADDYCVIHGRSDSTLNRYGIRIGTGEIYNVLGEIQEIRDALIVNLEYPDGSYFMPLFVQLECGKMLDPTLIERIQRTIKEKTSPRHKPDRIFSVDEIPYTLSGKKLEVPVKRILQGQDPEDVVSVGSMRNPGSLGRFIEITREIQSKNAINSGGGVSQ